MEGERECAHKIRSMYNMGGGGERVCTEIRSVYNLGARECAHKIRSMYNMGGGRESAHTKLGARTTLWYMCTLYVQCSSHIKLYRKTPVRSIMKRMHKWVCDVDIHH